MTSESTACLKSTDTVKAGDKVRVLMISSTSDEASRMSRGITRDSFEGVALNDLEEGTRFRVDCVYGELATSVVQRVGLTTFNTMNSTYAVEKLP